MDCPAPKETKTVRGVRLRRDPAREGCFRVVQTDVEMHEYPDMSETSRRERLHRHMNNETVTLEVAAQSLADFPDAPWDLRMELARQCWDESRHVTVLYGRLRELGGRKGEFPIANFEWGVTCMLDSLAARLAVQNRTFEAGELDLLGNLAKRWRDSGDSRTAEILEAILADEVQHVRFANQWVRRLTRDNGRVLLEVAVGLRFLRSALAALEPRAGDVNAVGTPLTDPRERIPEVNVDARREAAFSDEEIREILRQAGLEAIAP